MKPAVNHDDGRFVSPHGAARHLNSHYRMAEAAGGECHGFECIHAQVITCLGGTSRVADDLFHMEPNSTKWNRFKLPGLPGNLEGATLFVSSLGLPALVGSVARAWPSIMEGSWHEQRV